MESRSNNIPEVAKMLEREKRKNRRDDLIRASMHIVLGLAMVWLAADAGAEVDRVMVCLMWAFSGMNIAIGAVYVVRLIRG